jgi:CheY-like chemotaxis protein/HPt (histidine-containing phosphotransfer) domain-containing protein
MRSELGAGTTMSITLPLPVADPRALLVATPEIRESAGIPLMRRSTPDVATAQAEGTLVLLVDDHPTNRMVLVRQLDILGYAAEIAENGVEALKLWQSGRFALVITDCNMPEMDGYELARHIRKLESEKAGTRVPIIACTANALGGEAAHCFAAGMDDYLSKPVQLASLRTKLDQWLPLPTAEAKQSPPVLKPPATRAEAIGPLDRLVLAEISGGDQTVERQILADFRRTNDGDAVMLRQAVDKNDMSQIRRASHRIKGASRLIGAVGLARVCQHIESLSTTRDGNAVEASMAAFHQELEQLNAYFDSL